MMNRMTNCLFFIITFIFFNTGLAFREYFSFKRIWVVLKRTKSTCVMRHSGSFSTDSSCQLYIFWHYCDPFSMDGTEICVFKESYEISLCCILKCSHRCTCYSEICSEIMHNFSYESSERQFSNEEFRGFLISSNFW